MTTEEQKAYQKEYRENNKDAIRASGKKYRENNKDSILAKKKKYYQNNKDNIRVSGKEYREKNKDSICARGKRYRENNKDKTREYLKEYYQNNKDSSNARIREYKKNNRESLNVKRKEYQKNNRNSINATHREYYRNNRESLSVKIKGYRKKYNRRPEIRILNALRSRVKNILKGYKSAPTLCLVGIADKADPAEFLWQHLERQFQPGMTRENHGKWEIDHKIPCASFNLIDPQQQRECFHYSNIRPLWMAENRSKGSKNYEDWLSERGNLT